MKYQGYVNLIYPLFLPRSLAEGFTLIAIIQSNLVFCVNVNLLLCKKKWYYVSPYLKMASTTLLKENFAIINARNFYI